MRRAAFGALIVLIFSSGLSVGLNRSFDRHLEFVSMDYAMFARNHLAMGYAKTRLGMVASLPGERLHAPELGHAYYPNRGFVSSAVLSLWMRVFGERESSVRVHLILVGLISILLFSRIARRLMGTPWDAVATALFAFNPMFWYGSLCIVHMVYGLVFSLGAWLCALRWQADRQRWMRVGLFVSLFFACLSDWLGYYALLSIALHFALDGRDRWKLPAGLVAAALAFFALHLAHLIWLDSSLQLLTQFLGAPRERALLRSAGLFGFLRSELRETLVYFTVPVCLLGILGIVRIARSWMEAFWIFDESHPLHRALEQSCVRREVHGAFIFYRLR